MYQPSEHSSRNCRERYTQTSIAKGPSTPNLTANIAPRLRQTGSLFASRLRYEPIRFTLTLRIAYSLAGES